MAPKDSSILSSLYLYKKAPAGWQTLGRCERGIVYWPVWQNPRKIKSDFRFLGNDSGWNGNLYQVAKILSKTLTSMTAVPAATIPS